METAGSLYPSGWKQAKIDEDLEMVKELLSYGGYLVNCDHHVTPDVSYENLVYFINETRKLSAYDDDPRQIELPVRK